MAAISSLLKERRWAFGVVVAFLAIFCARGATAGFVEVTSSVGLIQQAKKSYGNPIWGDINNDGFLDLIVPTHGLTASGGPFVYLNSGGTQFIDIRSTCGIQEAPELDSTDWHGFSFGDYDGDGNLDLYIAEGAKMGTEEKRDLLFKGHGDGTFEYVSDVAGLITSTDRGRQGFWVDYDNDGKLDLFVKNAFTSNELYKNNGDGTFTVTTATSGLADATLGMDLGSTCSFADYDNDGYMDVFFSGDGSGRNSRVDALYRNNGDGTFSDVTTAAGIVRSSHGHGIAWGDYNNDGLLDLYVARVGDKAPTPDARLYRNNGDGTFTDVTKEAGLENTSNCYSAAWGDYDNDGYLDLFVSNAGVENVGTGNANYLYHNNGDGTFTEVAAEEGLQLEDNRAAHKGVAWADYDNDGFLDLIIKDGVGGETKGGGNALGLHRLFRNLGNTNHFIKVGLVGVESNRNGIGARVTARYRHRISFRENNGGGGGENASEGSEPIHFGIGVAPRASIEVDWPSGIVDVLPSVAANTTIQVTEGSSPRQ
ncbi:MAG TPA: CRTAC1 family protein [Chthoniobacterales bacterium]